ncbi:GDCCVxC domain-containing (seleno)protein [Thermopetrobacter sp. TC1]|uniref:GDCCVxC domain-containing (seleno)protein n=1 Tax=Thermopetrobacter sp. TC1 TaxID=1495045 RepID=UPI00056F722E|nr:GDCCVxC domain-containing (seleno)protein [Thermopetrobacter sp. TC1]
MPAEFTPVLHSTITCPHCGHKKTETMPTDACQWFYECTGCGVLLKPKEGDCCVFCSYGDVPCPPVQEARKKGNDENASCCGS